MKFWIKKKKAKQDNNIKDKLIAINQRNSGQKQLNNLRKKNETTPKNYL